MAAEVFRIGIPIEAVDKTAAGIKRASASLAAFERQKRAITVDNFLRNLPVAC